MLQAKAGLVSDILDAYNGHHNLVVRPDDFWIAIMSQFSFYVTKHSEALRDRLVSFEGKMMLTIYTGGNLFTANFGEVATRMVDEQIAKNIKDPSLASWAIPSFSTTKESDRIVAAISLMSSLQNFFEYKAVLECGIPNVTMLGTAADWKQLRLKVDKILEFKLPNEPNLEIWVDMLKRLTDSLSFSYENPNDPKTLEFWEDVASEDGGGSGPSFIIGWLGVFTSWTAKGEWQGKCEYEPSPFSSAVERTEWPVLDL